MKKKLIDMEGQKPESLKILLEYMNMSEEEFNKTISKMVVYPNKPNFKTNKIKKPKDFNYWYRDRQK